MQNKTEISSYSNESNFEVLEKIIIDGDLSKLNSKERILFYNKTCESLGLNPLTKPFDYIKLNNKLTLYAKKDATEQLRKVNKISIINIESKMIGDVYIVTAYAKSGDGREDVSTGAVNIKGLGGENLANAYLKAETKAKRRVTLSIGGLGFLDETEVDSIKMLANDLSLKKDHNIYTDIDSNEDENLRYYDPEEEIQKCNSFDSLKETFSRLYKYYYDDQFTIDKITIAKDNKKIELQEKNTTNH